MLDGDEAGRLGAVGVARTLNERLSVSVMALGDGCQPDKLTTREIRQLTDDRIMTRDAGTP